MQSHDVSPSDDGAMAPVLAGSEILFQRWADYRHLGSFDSFVEFALALNSLTALLGQMRLSGLARSYERLESRVLALFGDASTHPIPSTEAASIQRELAEVLDELRRGSTERPPPLVLTIDDGEYVDPPREVLVIGNDDDTVCASLVENLGIHGFDPWNGSWETIPIMSGPPFAVIVVPPNGNALNATCTQAISTLRGLHKSSHFLCVGVDPELDTIIELQRLGIDECVHEGRRATDVMARLFELCGTREHDRPRVLVVEDSQTAVAYIRRALQQHGLDSEAIGDPRRLVATAHSYEPDLVLMDMYMPHCTGVEATRALRQIARFRSVPIVYLSSETDIVQQVEALRLGGDQFLTKPANPVILAAVVKTKIERYREMRRLATKDSLTGLLNHSSAKQRLEVVRTASPPGKPLCAAMIDIDRFKSINDNFGHPLGDQVIRSLAWLIIGLLRRADPIGRYGGEEFLVGLPGMELDQAHAVLDRLRRDFSTLPHRHAKGALYATFSCGVAQLDPPGGIDELIARADAALLRAKGEGRNCVIRG